MKKIEILKSYCVDGKMKDFRYVAETENVCEFFDISIHDAEFLAKNGNGRVTFHRTEATLYINYLDVPDSTLVDVLMVAK